MLRTHGVGTWSDPGSDKPLQERDSIVCGHCGGVVYVKPGFGNRVYLSPMVSLDGKETFWVEEMGAGCRVCMRPVCLRCHHIGTCRPLEALLEAMERPHAHA